MKFHRRILFSFVVIALASAPIAAKDKWVNLTTAHFNIISNADEGETRRVARKLEQFRLFVFSTLFNDQATASLPVTVLVFKNDDSFKPYKPLYNGKPANVAGYFQKGDDENLIALTVGVKDERPLRTVFHEYMHFLASRTPRPWPLWMQEGLAEVYSTFDVNKNQARLGIPIPSHVYLLREKFMPLKSLFAVDHDSVEYNEQDKQGVFYAQSWALTHYFMFGNNRARQREFIDFVVKQQAGVAVEKAFAEAFKTDYAGMEKELRDYVWNESYETRFFPLYSQEADKTVSSRLLSEAEVQFNLGNLLMRTQRLDEAEQHFKRALDLDSNLARTYEGLGFIAMRRDKYEEAVEHFKQAVARDSKNYLAHYYFAEALMQDIPSTITPELARRVTDSLKTSIKLMPGFAHSYYLMGNLCLTTGENLQEGAQAIRAALRLEPQNKHFSITLAQLQVKLKEYDGAKKTLKPLLDDSNREFKQTAESILSLIEYYTRPLPVESASRAADETSEPAEAPRLRRRGEEESSSVGDREPPPTPGDATGRAGIKGLPTLKISGAHVLPGTLVAIECPKGRMVLVVRASDKLLRFDVRDVGALEFYSQDPKFDGTTITCGPVNKTAFIYYKGLPGTQTKYAGDAVAVEFTR